MAATRKRARKRRGKSEDLQFNGRIQDILEEVLEDTEKIRAEVMADHWRRHASEANLDVYWFRAEYLGGETLTISDAKSFLDIQAKDDRVAWEIRRICNNLSDDYGWDSSEALRFLLTGKAPMLRPIEFEKLCTTNGKWGNFARVTLSFDLSLSTSTLTRAIKRLKIMATHEGKRPIEEKAIRLAEIVSESMFEKDRTSEDGTPENRTPIRSYMANWNESYPDWSYRDVRHFVRDCRRAKKCVLFMNAAPPELGPGEEYPGAF